MKSTLLGASILTFTTGAALAGGIDRSGQGVNILFEEGDFAQFSYTGANPSVSGSGAGLGSHNDVANRYYTPSFGYKHTVNDALDIAIIYDQPFGADILYTAAPFAGGGADITSQGLTGLLRYKLDNGLSFYGGARGIKVGGTITSSLGLLDAQGDYDFGGVFGVAYEKPEIALRAALTYATAITSSLEGTHNVVDPRLFDVDFPESVNLDLQTGVAPGTLVFATVRWVGWDGFNLTTSDGEWVSFDDNTITYTLGVGRQINDKLSLALSAGYEKSTGKETTTLLAPTSGSTSIGIAATYQISERFSISGGVSYIWLGDTFYDAGGPILNFQDNTAIGAGVRIGMHF